MKNGSFYTHNHLLRELLIYLRIPI